MAGARDLHPASGGERSGQALGVLVVEDVALGTAHHEGRTGHLGDGRPQELAATLRGGRIEGAAAMALVVLPHPSAVGHAPQVVEQAPAQQGGVAPRVERQGARHELLDGVERRRLRREGGDLPYAGLTYLRSEERRVGKECRWRAAGSEGCKKTEAGYGEA